MSSSVMFWVGLAVLLFWAVGAYNRLVRQRSQGLLAFAVLDHLFIRFITMAKEKGSDSGALAAAADQFLASLKVARIQPLNGPTTNALKTAYETLCLCWQQVPDTLPSQWDQLAVQLDMARSDFNQSVLTYNQAIGQFPAVVLARVFGFRPAQLL
ncbi:MAG: LemA family protein [Rhodoferax sp.]